MKTVIIQEFFPVTIIDDPLVKCMHFDLAEFDSFQILNYSEIIA